VLSLYISPEEISQDELKDLVDRSYKTFRCPEVAPLNKVGEKIWILELFHGPTFAFKDVALQLLGNLFEFFLRRRNAKKGQGEKNDTLTIVGATSGDTGRYAALWVKYERNSLTIASKRCDIWPARQGEYINLHFTSQGSRLPHTRGTDDNGD